MIAKTQTGYIAATQLVCKDKNGNIKWVINATDEIPSEVKEKR